MRKNILTIIMCLCLITACNKDTKRQSLETKMIIDNQTIEKSESKEYEAVNSNQESDENVIVVEEAQNVDNEISDEFNDKPRITIESSINYNDMDEDEINIESIDYQIHKGRIDCDNEATCMGKSLPIQYKYKESISNVFYLEVISKKDRVLGYFIEYNFKEYKYVSSEECNNIGQEIQKDLSDRVTEYECTDGNILKIKTDYGKE